MTGQCRLVKNFDHARCLKVKLHVFYQEGKRPDPFPMCGSPQLFRHIEFVWVRISRGLNPCASLKLFPVSDEGSEEIPDDFQPDAPASQVVAGRKLHASESWHCTGIPPVSERKSRCTLIVLDSCCGTQMVRSSGRRPLIHCAKLV